VVAAACGKVVDVHGHFPHVHRNPNAKARLSVCYAMQNESRWCIVGTTTR
jgi:hypothetical protein